MDILQCFLTSFILLVYLKLICVIHLHNIPISAPKKNTIFLVYFSASFLKNHLTRSKKRKCRNLALVGLNFFTHERVKIVHSNL